MSRKKREIWGLSMLALIVAVVYVLAAAPGQAQDQAGEPKAAPKRPRRNTFLISRDMPDPAAVERGKKVFVGSCSFCHGVTARGGDSGPDLVRSVVALRDEGGDLIGPIIRNGVPDKGMPPLQMTDEQIADIAAFLRAQQQAAIDRRGYEIKNVVTGDAAQGKAFFNGAGGCKDCHSPEGDLKGIGSEFDAVSLQGRFLFPGPRRFGPGSGTPPPPVKVTVTPASGAPVSGVLVSMDDFNVALRDSNGYYRSFTRGKNVKVDVQDPLAAHVALLKKYTDADVHNVLAYLVTLQ